MAMAVAVAMMTMKMHAVSDTDARSLHGVLAAMRAETEVLDRRVLGAMRFVTTQVKYGRGSR